MYNWIILVTAVLFGFGCQKDRPTPPDYAYTVPPDLHDGLITMDLRQAGVDTQRVAAMTRSIVDGDFPNVHSLLIFRDSALVYERYLCGKDQKHGKNLGAVEHHAHSLHDVRSISKSVVSACMGIALAQRLIPDIDEPIRTYFPEMCERYREDDPRFRITVRHLLTMTGGWEWEEIGSNGLMDDETKMDLSFNPVRFVWEREVAGEPGQVWNYSAGCTQLLAEIIERQSGMPVDGYAGEHLFGPLGITESEWLDLALKKTPAAASGLRLTSRSLLKLGVLYLHSGNWNGRQILDSVWVLESMNPQVERPSLAHLGLDDGGYGFQFWTYDYEVSRRSLAVAEAKGNGGQSIFICKELGLVVVTTGGNYGKVEHIGDPAEILKGFILPAVI